MTRLMYCFFTFTFFMLATAMFAGSLAIATAHMGQAFWYAAMFFLCWNVAVFGLDQARKAYK